MDSNEYLSKIGFLSANVERAQLLKGAFSLEDCRQFLQACTTLVSLFKNEDLKIATKEDLDAFAFVVQGVRVQQAKGTFSMEGSVLMLEALEFLEKKLEEIKDPSLKLKELERKHSHKKKQIK